MSDTHREFRETVEANARDIFERMVNDELRMAIRDGVDDLHEIADSSVPVYYQEVVNVCLDGGLLNEEPEIEGATTPIQMMQYVLYDEALRIAYEEWESFECDEEDERERFRGFLSDNHWREYDDCEDAYHAFGSGRDTIESDIYDEVWEEFTESA